MPAKKQAKSRTSSKKSGFQFRWWMAAGLIVVVAIVGILVFRFSKASGGSPPGYAVAGPYYHVPYNGYDGNCDHYSFFGTDLCAKPLGNGYAITQFNGQTRCIYTSPETYKPPVKVTLWEIALGLCSG